MATVKVTQMRFYGKRLKELDTINKHVNNPPGIQDPYSYCEPTIFADYAPIQQIGIQTLPGTRFYINNNTEPVIIGASGIYEIDLRGTTAIISSIHFASESMKMIDEAENGYLIIDLVHQGGD